MCHPQNIELIVLRRYSEFNQKNCIRFAFPDEIRYSLANNQFFPLLFYIYSTLVPDFDDEYLLHTGIQAFVE